MPLDELTYDYDDEVLKLLIETDQILATEGDWIQGDVGAEDGPNCIVGAVKRAAHIGVDFQEIWPKVPLDTMYLLDRFVVNYVAGFNDDPTTTFADIKDLLQRAIAARRADLLAEARVL